MRRHGAGVYLLSIKSIPRWFSTFVEPHGGPASLNMGLRNESFRNYADYMRTEEFRQGIKRLLEVAAHKRTAIMCAEAVFWRCHRRLVSDFLLANGITVQHIMPSGELHTHTLTNGAKAEDGEVTYPGADLSN